MRWLYRRGLVPVWFDNLLDDIVWWIIVHMPVWLLDWNLRRMGYDTHALDQRIRATLAEHGVDIPSISPEVKLDE